MACRYREELVGKRFISVRSAQKLKIQKISEWEWRSGVVRALSSRDTSSLDLSVLIEFDDIDWTRREWVRIHDIFQLFLVEHTLVWAERPDPDKPRQSISWPGLSFRAVVDKVGLSACKRKPVEFLVDKFLGLVEEKEIQIFQEGEENAHPTALLRKEVQLSLKAWLDYQDGQKILLTTPTVLVGYRLEVYRAEGTTQWYTAVIQSYNHTSKTLSVTDDTVLEEHNEDPTLIQMHLIDDGVVDSILRGVEIGGIAPRRRPRAVKQEKEPTNSTTKPSSTAANQTPPVSRSALSRKSRTPQSTTTTTTTTSAAAVPVPAPSVVSVVGQETTDKQESKGTDRTVRQRQQNSKDRKRKVEPEVANEDTKSNSPSVNSKKRITRCEESNSKPQGTQNPQISTKTESSPSRVEPSRVSPRITPSKEKVKPQRTREIDKDRESSVENDIKDTVKVNGPVTIDSEGAQSKTKVRSRQKKEVNSPSQRTESPKSRTEFPRTRNSNPESSRTSQIQEAEAVIKSNCNSGIKKDRKSDRRVSKSAKSDISNSDTKTYLGLSKLNTSEKSSNKNTASATNNTSSDTSSSNKGKCDSDLVEQKLQEIKSAFESRKEKDGERVTKSKESKSEACVEKQTRRKDRKKNLECTQVELGKCAKKVNEEETLKESCERDTIGESGDNMHYRKKKQSLLSGGVPSGLPQNSGISSSCIDFNQSVTDQIARAEKLSNLGSEEKSGSVSSTLSSPVSEPYTDRNEQEFPSHPREGNKHIPNSLSSSHNTNTNSSWSQDERSQSCNSEDRCSSGFSDDLRRPGSRVDELKSSKTSPASSPLIVDKSEPVQIYRDPELMSKNPVRSNVPNMHNSHKSYPSVHNPIPTQASRPSSVGMSSTPLSSGLERTRTPVIPSVAYPSPLPLGASLPGASLSCLLPPGLHQLDPATLAMHQQVAALQQQHIATALASQYSNALSMSSYPPRGSLNSAQLEHLWQQKYPSVPVPPPWLLAKHQDDLIRDVRILHEQEQLERERMDRMERERELREREQRERKECERRDRERQEKERQERERREREKIEQERVERERLEREKLEKERLERERRERERLERERVERNRILKESVDSHAAVDQHFSESLRLASQRNWKRPPNHPNQIQEGYHVHSNANHHPKYTAAQTGMWPTPSITLGTGKPKTEPQSLPNSYKGGEKSGEIKPEEKIKQEQLREADYRFAEIMRKHQELMSQQEEYIKQRIYQKHLAAGEHNVKSEVKSEQAKDVKPVIYPGYPGKTEQLVNSSPSSVKREDGTASFSLYGYQPEKYSYITTDQLHSYELDKIKSEKANMDSKLVGRPQSPRKKDISVPPPLIKDSKPHSSVIVENKLKEGSMKSSSPHPAHQQYTSRMSPHHHPKPAHTPDRNHERPSPNSSSPGSSHGMSPSLAHSQHMAALNARQVTSRSQSPLRIASPQQLSVAVMQPMDYRCSPATNKSRGSPGSSGSPHLSVSSNVNSSGVYTPAIAQAPVSLPQSSVAFSYSLIQQGLVPNPIYTNNSQGKNSDSQRTVSVTGTAQVPRAASSPQGCGNNQQQQQQQQQQSAITQGTKRKGPKEGNNRKRQKGGESQVHTSPGSNNPLNLSIPVTTPQILTNQSPYTTCSVTASTSSAGSVATTSTTQSGGPLPTINNRLSGFSGFMDSFKSFVENTVQNAFMSDPELGKQKDGQMKRPTPEQLKQLQQQHQLQQQQQAALQGQTGKPKSSLERSSTPVTSQQSSSSSAIRNTNEDSNSNLGNSGNSTNSALLESINRVANGQVDTDSDTLSAPSPPPHLKQENNTASPHKSAKHPNLKKAWLQRHSDEDKQEVKPAVSALSQQPMPVKMETETSNSNDMFGELSGELDKDDKDKDKEQVKNCYVNCSYISPSKEGGSKSPISAIQTVLPNGTVEKNGIDESTTSASETEIQPADNSRKRVKTKKERNTNTKKPKTEVQELSASPISTSPTNTNNPDPVTSTPGSTNTTTVDQNSSTASSSNSNTSNSSQNNQTNKKKNSRRNKDSKPKNSPDTMSEEQIKKIVENCKDSVKEKEKDTKPTEEAYDKMFDTDESSSLSKNDPSESEANKSDQERMENEINRKAERKDKKKNKDKKDKKNRKEKQKEKEKQYEDEDEVEMKEVIHAAPPPILKETEIKISQQTSFAKPLVRVPVSVLRKTCEPFLQDGSCSEVTPKLMKCRECKMTPTQRGKTVPNIFCRFYAFRRLKYSQRGFVTIDGFSELTDAEQDDIDPWIPKSPINEPRFDVETAKFIIRRVGDKFCELVQQERDAQFCAGENAKVAWKRAVTGVREMCDVCDTTLFNMHWVCHKCGFVVCLDCYTVKARELRDEETENTDSSDDESSEEQRKWLTCSANRQPHDVDKLMLTQIIPADALWEVGRLIHEVRDKWTLQSSCKCNNKHPVKKNGIKTDLMHEAIKHLSPKKKMVNGIGGEHKPRTKNGNIKTAVYHPDSTSPLSLLADVASMDSEKTRDRSESPFSKKKEGKQGKSYTPITEPVSPGSGEKKMPPSCSTLRELLTKTAGAKAKNNSDSNNKKKTKNTSSLDDIIQKVVEKQIPKEMSPTNLLSNETVNEPMKLLHYTPRFGKCHKLTRETPILIHNLTETSVLYPDVPHSWLCDGRLLRLHDPLHKGNLKIFMEQWRRGQPVLVSGADKYMNQHLWKPEFFSKQFGELENDLVNCRTGCLVVGQPMKHFWDGFNCMEERLVDEEGTPMLLKLKDWPPSDDFSDLLPQQFNDLMQALPLPEYTRRDGRLNVVSRLPDFLVKPDLGPKMYIAYGSAQFPKEGTTNLHLDVSDATNVMVYVGYLDDEQKGHMQKDAEAIKAMEMARCDSITKRRIKEVHESPGALWHIFDAVDADKIRDFLNKVGKERGEKVEQDHDPIHDQSWYLDELLRDRLAKEYGVLGYTIIQCLGDAIFIPAGAPHQVRNLNNCIKVAEDFVSAENIHHCFNLTEEFRHLSDGHSNHEDKLQVKNIVYHAVKDAVAVLKDAEREDCDDGF